jgi:hypothetical protein
MRRIAGLVVAAMGLALLPAGAVGAEEDSGSVAYCSHAWSDTADPGIEATPGTSHFTSNGEKWPLICEGTVRGARVTGRGTFGEYGTIDGACAAGSGKVNFFFTIPTSAGFQRFRLSFDFTYGPGGATSESNDFPGAFVFYPRKGDCWGAPVTEFDVVRSGVLFS